MHLLTSACAYQEQQHSQPKDSNQNFRTQTITSVASNPCRAIQSSNAEQVLSSNPSVPDDEQLMEEIIFDAHSDRVISSIFSPDSKLIASISFDNTIKIWDLDTTEVLHSFSMASTEQNGFSMNLFGINPSSKLAFIEDGQILVLGNGHGSIISWHLNTGEIVDKLQGRPNYAVATAFSPDGQMFANYLAIERDSPQYYGPDKIEIRDVKTLNQIALLTNVDPPGTIALGSRNQFLVSLNTQGGLKIWDLNSNEILRQFQGGRALALSSNDQLLASDDPTCKGIKVWDFSTGEEIYLLDHVGFITSLVFNSDATMLGSSSLPDGVIKLWDMRTGEKIVELQSDEVNAISFSPNGELLASSNFDNTVRVWNIEHLFKD